MGLGRVLFFAIALLLVKCSLKMATAVVSSIEFTSQTLIFCSSEETFAFCFHFMDKNPAVRLKS